MTGFTATEPSGTSQPNIILFDAVPMQGGALWRRDDALPRVHP